MNTTDIKPFDLSESCFLSYEYDKYAPPPKPSLNGGLYTGEAFQTNAKYRNFPNEPDVVYLRSTALLSANPPPGAISQYTASELLRPGNNVANNLPKDLNTMHLDSCGTEKSSVTCTKSTDIKHTNQKMYSRSFFK